VSPVGTLNFTHGLNEGLLAGLAERLKEGYFIIDMKELCCGVAIHTRDRFAPFGVDGSIRLTEHCGNVTNDESMTNGKEENAAITSNYETASISDLLWSTRNDGSAIERRGLPCTR
jgi:hypothetical protein